MPNQESNGDALADTEPHEVPTPKKETNSLSAATDLRRSQRQTRPPQKLTDYVLAVKERWRLIKDSY